LMCYYAWSHSEKRETSVLVFSVLIMKIKSLNGGYLMGVPKSVKTLVPVRISTCRAIAETKKFSALLVLPNLFTCPSLTLKLWSASRIAAKRPARAYCLCHYYPLNLATGRYASPVCEACLLTLVIISSNFIAPDRNRYR
jgi:hypothetical protein